MNETKIKNERIDGLLTKYFEAEVPSPWPAFAPPEEPGVLPVRRSPWLTFRRCAVAASIAALLAGYLALAGFFPREAPGRLNSDPSRNIGKNPQVQPLEPNR